MLCIRNRSVLSEWSLASVGRRCGVLWWGENRYFLMYLFCEQSMAIQFLQDIGLLRSKMQCNTCGRDMTWSADRNITEGFRWRCHRSVAGTRCNQSVSIKFGSWFQQSNLMLHEIMLMTYDIVRRVPAVHIRSEYHLRYQVCTSSILTILRLGFKLFFLLPRTFAFAITTIPILH